MKNLYLIVVVLVSIVLYSCTKNYNEPENKTDKLIIKDLNRLVSFENGKVSCTSIETFTKAINLTYQLSEDELEKWYKQNDFVSLSMYNNNLELDENLEDEILRHPYGNLLNVDNVILINGVNNYFDLIYQKAFLDDTDIDLVKRINVSNVDLNIFVNRYVPERLIQRNLCSRYKADVVNYCERGRRRLIGIAEIKKIALFRHYYVKCPVGINPQTQEIIYDDCLRIEEVPGEHGVQVYLEGQSKKKTGLFGAWRINDGQDEHNWNLRADVDSKTYEIIVNNSSSTQSKMLWKHSKLIYVPNLKYNDARLSNVHLEMKNLRFESCSDFPAFRCN